jgi:hypothetical protein
MGGGQREAEFHHVGHRYDRAHALRPTDGWTEKLQPEEQGQEELFYISWLLNLSLVEKPYMKKISKTLLMVFFVIALGAAAFAQNNMVTPKLSAH